MTKKQPKIIKKKVAPKTPAEKRKDKFIAGFDKLVTATQWTFKPILNFSETGVNASATLTDIKPLETDEN